MSTRAFIFPGQGSQFVGMGRDVYERFPEARAVYDQATEAVAFDLKGLCFQGPEDTLSLTTYTQPAILTTSLALWACLGNPDAAFFAGHSLGEFTAMAAGGALDWADAARLVMARGRSMQEAVPSGEGAMAAVIGLENQAVEEVCTRAWETGRVWPANYNCPGQVVITGERPGVEMAMALAREKGARHALLLPVSIPSHCPLMESAASLLANEVDAIALRDSRVPILSNSRAAPVHKRDDLRGVMIEQMTSPVRWDDGIRLMIREGVTTFIEVGPGRVLTGLVRRIDKGVEVIPISDVPSLELYKETL
ncbi:MAG: ACP S-malonyltransferase [bacterium]